jgi:hypothetical protein
MKIRRQPYTLQAIGSQTDQVALLNSYCVWQEACTLDTELFHLGSRHNSSDCIAFIT